MDRVNPEPVREGVPVGPLAESVPEEDWLRVRDSVRLGVRLGLSEKVRDGVTGAVGEGVTVPVPQAVNSRSDRLASKAVDPQGNSAGSSPP